MKGCLATYHHGQDFTPTFTASMGTNHHLKQLGRMLRSPRETEETSEFSKISPSRAMCRHHGGHSTLPPLLESNLATGIEKLQNMSLCPFTQELGF